MARRRPISPGSASRWQPTNQRVSLDLVEDDDEGQMDLADTLTAPAHQRRSHGPVDAEDEDQTDLTDTSNYDGEDQNEDYDDDQMDHSTAGTMHNPPVTSPAHVFIANTLHGLSVRPPFSQTVEQAGGRPTNRRINPSASPIPALPTSNRPARMTTRRSTLNSSSGVPSRRAPQRATVSSRSSPSISREDRDFIGVFLIGFIHSANHQSIIGEIAAALGIDNVDMYYTLARLARRLAPSSRTTRRARRQPVSRSVPTSEGAAEDSETEA